MQPKCVLIVDDSVFMRKIISDLVSELSGFVVVGTAKNGLEAIEMTKKLKPDCITMDVEMPELDGLEALKQIMKEIPTPVIMLSSLTHDGALETIQALEWGAVDFVQKPSGAISLDLFKVKETLREKLEIAVNTNVNKVVKYELPLPVHNPVVPPWKKKPEPTKAQSTTDGLKEGFEHLVAIGTSTGGPRALHQVLCQLPENFPAPIVVVQHMPPNFTNSLAMRLDSNSKLRVVEGKDGMSLKQGTAYIAPGGYHMTVQKDPGNNYYLRLSKEPPRGGHRPSVDTLFESLLPYRELKRHIVIMTGMGSDGAKGMLALKQDGAASTVAESEETCVVYGMPRAAVELNCVDHTLPVNRIAEKLVQTLMK